MKDFGLYRQGKLTDAKYCKQLEKLAPTHTAKEIADKLNVAHSTIHLHLRKLGITSKYARKKPFCDKEDINLVQELLNANFTVREIADKYDASYSTARDFIARNELKIQLHPSLEDLAITSYTALQKKENPEAPVLRVVPLRETNRVIIREDEYIKLWEKAYASAQQ